MRSRPALRWLGALARWLGAALLLFVSRVGRGALAPDGIGEHPAAVDLDQQRGVAEPRHAQARARRPLEASRVDRFFRERRCRARAESVNVALPRPGQSIGPDGPRITSRWWPDVPRESAELNPVISTGVR